jgi:hypothetical protein
MLEYIPSPPRIRKLSPKFPFQVQQTIKKEIAKPDYLLTDFQNDHRNVESKVLMMPVRLSLP